MAFCDRKFIIHAATLYEMHSGKADKSSLCNASLIKPENQGHFRVYNLELQNANLEQYLGYDWWCPWELKYRVEPLMKDDLHYRTVFISLPSLGPGEYSLVTSDSSATLGSDKHENWMVPMMLDGRSPGPDMETLQLGLASDMCI